uniref:Uncharacterized protein n=1 Tax=Anopheles christyi TaxID=43041 RepID=A0A182K5S5_9DIPT
MPACLDNVNSLKILKLSQNEIQNATIESFASMKQLLALDLSCNCLTTIMLNSHRYPASLTTLRLEENMLTELDLSLISVPSLVVDVRMNCIAYISKESISPKVKKLDMALNPLDCSWETLMERNKWRTIFLMVDFNLKLSITSNTHTIVSLIGGTYYRDVSTCWSVE